MFHEKLASGPELAASFGANSGARASAKGANYGAIQLASYGYNLHRMGTICTNGGRGAVCGSGEDVAACATESPAMAKKGVSFPLWSMLVWFYFSTVLHVRNRPNWQGKSLDVLVIAGFGLVMFTFLGLALVLQEVSHPLR